MQEALTNAIKHAEAGSVSVVLTRTPHSVTAVVEDNGRGIQPVRDSDADGAEGLGLVGMRERVALLARPAPDRVEPRARERRSSPRCRSR